MLGLASAVQLICLQNVPIPDIENDDAVVQLYCINYKGLTGYTNTHRLPICSEIHTCHGGKVSHAACPYDYGLLCLQLAGTNGST